MLNITKIRITYSTPQGPPQPILKDFSLNVTQGERVTILGHNGSGKSTLLRAIAGNIMSSTGTITVSEHDITALAAYKRSNIVGYVQQNTSLGTALQCTVADNLFFAFNTGAPLALARSQTHKQRAKIVLSKNPTLKQHRKSFANNLSGGQRQLLAVLMVMQKNTPLLLLDEVTAALDPQAAKNVMSNIYKTIQDTGQTVLSVTHNPRHALLYSTRIIILSEGKIVHDIPQKRIEAMDDITLAKLLIDSMPSAA